MMADEPRPDPSEPTKNEIWHEVERRFEHPPAALVERIEREVEKRVTAREKHYRTLAIVSSFLIGLIILVAGYASYYSIRKDVEALIASTEVGKANQEIKDDLALARSQTEQITNQMQQVAIQSQQLSGMTDSLKIQQTTMQKDILSLAEAGNAASHVAKSAQRNIDGAQMTLNSITSYDQQASNLTLKVIKDSQDVSNRLAELNKQDNVLVSEDLQKLFIRQSVTNLVDGNKILLDYDPIPRTVQMIMNQGAIYEIEAFSNQCRCYLEGRTIVFTSNEFANAFLDLGKTGRLNIGYMRASKTE